MIRRPSLRFKNTLLIAAAVLLSAAASTVVVGRFSLSLVKAELEEKGLTVAQSMGELIAQGVIDENRVSTREALIDVVGRTQDIGYAVVIGFDGSVLAHTFEGGFPRALLDVYAAEAVEGSHRVRRLWNNGRPLVDLSHPVIDGMSARLHLGLDESRLYSGFRRKLLQLAAWILAIAGVAVLFGSWATVRTVRPLERLATAIAEYGRGLPVSIDPRDAGSREAGRLSEAFLQMMSDRDRATRELRESEERFSEIAAGIREVFWLFDWKEQRVLYVNPASESVWGRPAEDLYRDYRQWGESVHPDDQEQAAESFARIVVTGGGEDREYRVVRPDGEVRWVSDRGFAIRDDQGDVVRITGIVEDITERKQAEEERQILEAQLLQAQKLESLGVLAGGIAHDFNNLLSGVMGNADLALTRLDPASPAREYLDDITVAAERAADLANQLLAYSGRGKLVTKALDLSELVRGMAHLIKVSQTNRTVVRYDLEKGLPAIEADATQLRQIVLNLVTNAAEAVAGDEGLVAIRTGVMECDAAYLSSALAPVRAVAGRYVFLEVSDTGCGMDTETQQRIFDPFFSTKATGRGLGLAAVLGIVGGHSGAVKVSSEPGRGTSLKVLFPASSHPAQREESAAEGGDTWQGLGKVLVADDEKPVRTVTKRLLEDLGFEVLTAADGREALEIYAQHATDLGLVLLDLTMPRLGGEETLREMRSIRSDVRAILMSGYNEQGLAEQSWGANPPGFLQKPFRASTLKEEVRAVLEAPSSADPPGTTP